MDVNRRAGLAAFLLLAVSTWATPARADGGEPRVLTRQTGETGVAAHGDRVMWSESAGDRWHLVSSAAGGPPTRLPVRPRRVPFDADLGPDQSGRTVAVYSRCRHDPPRMSQRGVQDFLPTFARGRGCDIYRFDFERAREFRIRGASRRAVSEFLPSIWRKRLVFGLVDPRRRGARGVHPQMNALQLDKGRRRMRLRGGSMGYYEFSDPAKNTAIGGPGLVSLDLRGRRLAYVWDLYAGCPSRTGDAAPKDDDIRSELWLQKLGHRPRRIGLACNQQRVQAFQSPSLTAGLLTFATRGTENMLLTRDLTSGVTTSTPAPRCLVGAVRSGTTVYSSQLVPCTAATSYGPRPLFEVWASSP